MNKRKVPKLRFKGFTDDWEQRKWSDTVDISTEMVDPTSGEYDDMPHIAPGNIESFTGRILDNVKSVKEEQLISGKFRFRPGDVVYGKINPQLGKYFYASVDGLTSADAYVFNGKNGITQKFLFSLLQTQDFFKYSVSVSKRSGMPKINRDELNAYNFLAPEENEQEQIGNFLLDLDNLITLHQRKLEKLKIIKKSMLENCFPKNGEKIPKFRFDGFSGDWEQRKLGEEAIEILAGGDIDKEKAVEEGKYPIYANALTNDGIVGYYNVYYRVKAPAVTVTGRGEVGHAQARMNDFTPVVRLLAIRSNHDCYFLENAINNHKVVVESTGVPQLTVPQLSSYDIFFPSNIEEEAKIGEYFHSLDNLITLHQRKLEKLKVIKKSMLESMFV